MEKILPGSWWRHKNGNAYKVLYIANEHADETNRDEYPMMVVYQGPDMRVWAKSPEGFLRSRTPLPETYPILAI